MSVERPTSLNPDVGDVADGGGIVVESWSTVRPSTVSSTSGRIGSSPPVPNPSQLSLPDDELELENDEEFDDDLKAILAS